MDWLDNAEFELNQGLAEQGPLASGLGAWAATYGHRLLQRIKILEAAQQPVNAVAKRPFRDDSVRFPKSQAKRLLAQPTGRPETEIEYVQQQ